MIGAVPGAVNRGTPNGPAIATVTVIGYLGSFTGPPVFRLVAETTGQSLALLIVVAAALTAAALSPRVLPRTQRPATR